MKAFWDEAHVSSLMLNNNNICIDSQTTKPQLILFLTQLKAVFSGPIPSEHPLVWFHFWDGWHSVIGTGWFIHEASLIEQGTLSQHVLSSFEVLLIEKVEKQN